MKIVNVFVRPILFLAYAAELLAIYGSWNMYVSHYKWLPWHEASEAQSLVVFIICIPLLSIVGLILLILKNRAKIPKWNLWMPWIAVACMGLPIINGHHSGVQVLIGFLLVTLVFVFGIYFNIKHLVFILRQKMP